MSKDLRTSFEVCEEDRTNTVGAASLNHWMLLQCCGLDPHLSTGERKWDDRLETNILDHLDETYKNPLTHDTRRNGANTL